MNAQDILRKSAQHIDDRAASRDQAQGERSMARTVAAFNAITGHQLSERDGWLFMVQLKMARACTTRTGIGDDYEDMAAYSALAGEGVAGNDNDGGGWIPWIGGDCPVSESVIVDFKTRSLITGIGYPAGSLHWKSDGSEGDIVSWRMTK